jgi:hypothetical protein
MCTSCLPWGVVLLTIVFTLLFSKCTPTRADGFDSLINQELAFRDRILDQQAPLRYQALIRDGETTITFISAWPDGVGKTDFFLDLSWSYDYEYKTQQSGEQTLVTVQATNVRVKPRLRHVIRMPDAFYRSDVWESQLLGHEFDHVAISLDPRPRALLIYLCRHLPAYQFSMNGEGKPSEKKIQDGIDGEIRRRQTAVLDLVRANYVSLDKVSQNGRTAMKERRNFFESLYTRSNLTNNKFPFQNEVASLMESEAYQRLRPRHSLADPSLRSGQ